MNAAQQIIENPFEAIFNDLKTLKEMIAVLDHRLKNDAEYSQDLLPVLKVHELYSIGRSTLYTYHREGDLMLYKFKGKTYVSIQELEAEIRKYPIPHRSLR